MNIPLENLEILQKSINELKNENQELKDTNMKYAKLIDDFQTKNMRLEKAIEILKERGGIYLYINRNNNNKLTLDFDDCISCVLEPKEYELLKEVLCDE